MAALPAASSSLLCVYLRTDAVPMARPTVTPAMPKVLGRKRVSLIPERLVSARRQTVQPGLIRHSIQALSVSYGV